MNLRATFDPLTDILVAQTSKPEGLKPLNFRTLNPFQRALMVIDGTVTKFIEAYMMEPIDIVRISQEEQRLEESHEWLEAPAGTLAISREVLLRGKYSHRIYAYAISILAYDRLSSSVKKGLEVDGGGLGRILRSDKLETYREIMWYGRERFKELPEHIRELTHDDFLSRTYRILVGGRPIMVINEKFPCGLEDVPAHH